MIELELINQLVMKVHIRAGGELFQVNYRPVVITDCG